MAVPFSAKIGGREVVGSGSVMVRGDDSAEFELADIKLKITFGKAADGKAAAQAHVLGEKYLHIELLSFESPLGTAAYWKKIGSINERPLSLGVFVHALPGEAQNRLLNFQFELGEANRG